MEVSEEIRDGILILHLDGNLDMLHAGILKERLNKSIEESNFYIVLDFQKVSFVDSSGFGLLIHTNEKMLKKFNKKLKVCNVNKSVQQIFKISKVGEIVEIYNSLSDAIQSCK